MQEKHQKAEVSSIYKKSGQGGRKFRCRPVIFRAKIFERRKEKKGREKEKKGRKKTETRATTYSPAKRIAVPSAREGLTAGFGMGPGGPPPQLSLASLLYLTEESGRGLISKLRIADDLFI